MKIDARGGKLRTCMVVCALLALMPLAMAANDNGAGVSALDVDYTPGSGWAEFYWGGGEPVWDDTSPFTFTSDMDMPLLKVTDGFLSGDQFEVYDNGEYLFTTAAPGSVGDSIGSDYDAAYADDRWSSGSYMLEPGDHSLRFLIIDNPYGGGRGAFEVTVPEPTALALLALGGLALLRRR